jgi:hypothetical protein
MARIRSLSKHSCNIITYLILSSVSVVAAEYPDSSPQQLAYHQQIDAEQRQIEAEQRQIEAEQRQFEFEDQQFLAEGEGRIEDSKLYLEQAKIAKAKAMSAGTVAIGYKQEAQTYLPQDQHKEKIATDLEKCREKPIGAKSCEKDVQSKDAYWQASDAGMRATNEYVRGNSLIGDYYKQQQSQFQAVADRAKTISIAFFLLDCLLLVIVVSLIGLVATIGFLHFSRTQRGEDFITMVEQCFQNIVDEEQLKGLVDQLNELEPDSWWSSISAMAILLCYLRNSVVIALYNHSHPNKRSIESNETDLDCDNT